MEQATEKQIAYATNLGIDNPESFSKIALKELISAKLGGDKPQYQAKPQSQAPVQATNTVEAVSIVISKKEAPNSYEFGKAGDRFKLYFGHISDLKKQLKELEDAGMITDPLEVKPEDFAQDD